MTDTDRESVERLAKDIQIRDAVRVGSDARAAERNSYEWQASTTLIALLAKCEALEAKLVEAQAPDISALLLRAVQEALNMAARHAASVTGDVEVFNTILALTPDEIVKKVKEEGNG